MKPNEPMWKNEPSWKKGLYLIAVGIALAVVFLMIRPHGGNSNFNEGFLVTGAIFVILSWIAGVAMIVAHFIKRGKQ